MFVSSLYICGLRMWLMLNILGKYSKTVFKCKVEGWNIKIIFNVKVKDIYWVYA